MRSRYSTVAILFHWSMALLIIVNLVIGFFHDAIGGMPIHKATGLTLLALAAFRIMWRVTHRPPSLPTDIPTWQRRISVLVHWTFYALMVAMPLTGWIMVSNAETLRPLTWFWLFDLPYLTIDHGAYAPAKQGHLIMAFLFAGLLIVHIAAALKHHLIDRDSVLQRMLPTRVLQPPVR
jgi:cytochrome b561